MTLIQINTQNITKDKLIEKKTENTLWIYFTVWLFKIYFDKAFSIFFN